MPVIINEIEGPVDAGRSEGQADPGQEYTGRLPAGFRSDLPDRSGLEGGAPLFGVYPAQVVAVADPEGQGRVQVSLPWAVDPEAGPLQIWARLATLMAGRGRGTWFVPDVGDEVLVAFEAGDVRRPYVVGALWNGADSPPVSMDGAGDNNLKVIHSRAGVRITLDDTPGDARLICETPNGQRITLEDSARRIKIDDGSGSEIHLSNGQITVNASMVTVNAGMVQVNSGMSRFSGVVQCDTLIANSVVSASYTPGAGNIW